MGEHSVICQQKPLGMTGRWVRLDVSIGMPAADLKALARKRRLQTVVMTWTPYRRWWHRLLGWAPPDRIFRLKHMVLDRRAKLTVPAQSVGPIEQAVRKKCGDLLLQLEERRAAGVVLRGETA